MAVCDSVTVWQELVFEKLKKVYEKENGRNYIKLCIYLSREASFYRRKNEIAPVWLMLKSVLNSDEMFKAFADGLLPDANTAENDSIFCKVLRVIYNHYMYPISDTQGQRRPA